MVLSPKLELRQGQQLVMTPQLQQAIRLLQLSNIELCSFIEAELERNPLLEREEVPAEEGAAAAVAAEEEADWSDRDDAMPLDGAPAATKEPGRSNAGDGSASDLEQAAWAALRPRTVNSFDSDSGGLDRVLSSGASLMEHLTGQLNLAITD